MNSKYLDFVFLLVIVIGISFFYQYPKMLHMLPQGSHLWRQTYSMDMALNYKQYHLSFFKPEVSNLLSQHGKAAAEFPIFYFISAKFNDSEYVLRILHTILFFFGIIATYFIAFYFLKERLLSLYVMLLLFSSPLLVFYGNNFLTDVPALSLTYMAWAFYLYASKSKYPYVYISFFFLLLSFSCLLKASQALNYGILLMLLILNPIGNIRRSLCLLIFIITFFPVILWYYYARQYNIVNHHTYFFLGTYPIWKLNFYDIGLTAWRITISWSKNYFWRPVSILLIICSILYWKYRKQILNKELYTLVLSSFLFSLIYLVLFYERLMKHEYYYTTFFMFVACWIILIFYIFQQFYSKILSWIKVIIGCLLIINIIYCKNFIAEKLTDARYNIEMASADMQIFLTNHGVANNKTILSLPDDTPCQTLYLLKRKGYTAFNNYDSILKNRLADYLIITNSNTLPLQKLKPYLNDSIANYHGIVLYKLR